MPFRFGGDAVHVYLTINSYNLPEPDALIGATRAHPLILRGASPRATLSVTAMAKSVAYVQGRDYVVPKDVQTVFVSTVAHRLLMSPEAEAKAITPETVLEEILKRTPAPRV